MVPSDNLSFVFPDEYASPKTKEKPKYGLQAAQAMYYSQNRFGYRLFGRDEKIDALFELAQGRNSTDNIRRMFGFHDNAQGATQDDQGALAYIDVQVVNLATTYVNRAVAKLQRNKYDINLSAVDPLSVDEAKEMNARLQTYYHLKDWMENLNIDAQKLFPDLNIADLPQTPDELMYQLSTNTKIQKVIDGEKTIKLLNNVINDTDQVLRECDWDMVVAGRAHAHCYLDQNKIPRVERINPKYWGGSYVDNEDYSKGEYQFFIEFITKNQFKKEVEFTLEKEKIDQVLNTYTFANAITAVGTLPEYYQRYDGLEYIPVMRFYFLSNDARAYVKWKNANGNPMIDERHAEYQRDESGAKRDVIRTNVTSVYGGSWVLDSDVVFNYGRKEIPRTTLVNTRLPIVTFAPNMKNGRVVSLLSQMIEPLTMFNVAWNKVKDILAKGRMNVWELNISKFENIALGTGGEVWSSRQAIDFLFQTNIAVTRQETNQYGQQTGQAIKELASGLQLGDYFTTMAQCVNMLDKLSASTVAEAAVMPDRLAVGAMKANIAAGNEGIEYLVNGHRQIYHQVTHMLLLLTQEAKRDKTAIQGMIPALGQFTTEYFEVPDNLPYCEYGLIMETEPSQEEWMQFYAEVANAVLEGKLNASDSAFIRMVKNLKQARFIMANREKINERKMNEMRQQEQQFQMQITDKSAQDKLALEMQILDKKKQDEIELMSIQARIDDAAMLKKMSLEAEMQNVSEMVKKEIAKQQGIDSILKEAMRSRSEDYKSDKKFDADIHKAERSAETSVLTTHMSNQAKKESDKKKKEKATK